MKSFNDFMKEAWQEGAGKAKLSEKELSPKQKNIAAVAGDKDKIDAADLAALRNGKKPVEEASCSGNMKKEELVGNQHKLDKNKNGKLDAHDFKLLRKEEAEQIDELSKKTLGSYAHKAMHDSENKAQDDDNIKHTRAKGIEQASKKLGDKSISKDSKTMVKSYASSNKAMYSGKEGKRERDYSYAHQHSLQAHDKIQKASGVKEEVELDEGRVKELAMDLKDMSHDEFHKRYGKPKSHFDSTNFKKPVEPGKGMDRAKALAQRGMQSLSKEEVERIEEKLAQLDELSPTTLKSYKKGIYRDLDRAADAYPHGTGDDDEDRKLNNRVKGDELADKKLQAKGVNPYSEEVEQIDELSKGTLASYVGKAAKNVKTKTLLRKDFEYNANSKSNKNPEIDRKIAGEFKDEAEKRLGNINKAAAKLAKEEVSAEMSPYLKATLKVMDEGKIDNLRDAQKLRQDTQSAYDKNYKPDTSHPHIQVVKGNKYGGSNQKDDEGDEKPDNETKEKKGRGRPTGSKSGARQKGNGHEDGGIPVHNLHLPNRNK
jgi:hypothetical protein